MPNKTRSTIYDLVAALAKIAILADLGPMPPAAPAFVAGRAPDGDMLAVIRRLISPRCPRDAKPCALGPHHTLAGHGRDSDTEPHRKAGTVRLVAPETRRGAQR